MKMNRIILAAIALAAMNAYAQTPSLRFKTVNDPQAALTVLSAVNNSGTSVGWSFGQVFDIYYGIVAKGATVTRFSHPGAQLTDFYGVNSAGAIVGLYTTTEKQQAFLFQNGRSTDVGPTGQNSGAFGINDAGQIAGLYYGGDNIPHGFLCNGTDRTHCQTINAPGAALTYAWDVNNSGVVTLQGQNEDGTWHGWLYDSIAGTFTNIDVPGAISTYPGQINAAGDVAIGWQDASRYHGAVLRGGRFVTFDYPRALDTFANGINDQGTLSGAYDTDGVTYQGFEAKF
jgi:probable HAF family extracellular repeat protein